MLVTGAASACSVRLFTLAAYLPQACQHSFSIDITQNATVFSR